MQMTKKVSLATESKRRKRLVKLDSGQAVLCKSCPQGLILILSLCNFRRTPPKTLVVAVICHNTNYKQTPQCLYAVQKASFSYFSGSIVIGGVA